MEEETNQKEKGNQITVTLCVEQVDASEIERALTDNERDMVTSQTIREHIGLIEEQYDAGFPDQYHYYIDAFEFVLEYFSGERRQEMVPRKERYCE